MIGQWFVLFLVGFLYPIYAISNDDLLVVSVATNETDGYLRFIRSLNVYGYNHETYGLGQPWKGGNIQFTAGGGQKINFLRENLVRYKDDTTKIILFSDSYDVMFTQTPENLLEKFEKFKPARVIFGAEDFCWPDQNLEYEYPFVESNEKRFLNSGGFIGYASDIYEMITSKETIKDDEDDQLFYTKIFLDKNLRDKWSIVLDKKADIFMNLNGAVDEIELPLRNDEVYVHNSWTDSDPIVIHGNGPAKRSLNYLSNYIARTWSSNAGCLQCKENVIDLTKIDDQAQWPLVYIAAFIEYPTPFLEEYFEKILNLTYPKNRLAIFIHNQVEYHKNLTDKYMSTFKENEYKFVKYLSYDDDTTEGEARQQAITECQEDNCDYLFVIDSVVQLDNPDTLLKLISLNRTILAPMLMRPEKTWSNFWGDYTEEGYYRRSPDYLDIINYNKTGLFNVPHISNCYLINGTFLKKFTPQYIDPSTDPDVKFSQSIRDAGFFLYVNNELTYGHLMDPDNFNTSLIIPELYEIFTNFLDWKARYIHPDYYKSLEPNATFQQPCLDVFWFPVVTKRFTEDLVDLMEKFNRWSGSAHNDGRLAGGYENVPTDDIHMTQVGLNDHWLYFLKEFIQPIQQKLYTGYFSDPPKAALNFVVRYMPEYQYKLRPHHDASTYTINIALNDAGKDYEGGGCRFLRYNCTIAGTRRGWTLMHPGRLTHFHEDIEMSTTTESSSFISNTLKRRQQKRQEASKVLQEGISSLHLSSIPNEQQATHEGGIYPLFNIDPESYLLEEGDERSMLEPNSYNNPNFKQTINVLFNWLNTSLSKNSIIIRSFENDLYDGYILAKLIEYYQPHVRLLLDDIPLSEESKKKTLERVLNYLETRFSQQNLPVQWTFEQVYNRDLICILHLLLACMQLFNVNARYDLPKNLLLKVIVVKKINGILQTRIVNECFIDDYERELASEMSRKQGDLIDTLFDLAPDRLAGVEKILLNFINNQLNRYNIHVKQIDIEYFQDGLNLLYLISNLENYFIILNKYYHKKPLTREQSHANIQLAFQLMNQAGIEIDQYCRINDLISGNQRTLYRLLFQLYLRYNKDSNNLLKSISSLASVRMDADSPFL
ncbi:unnamed protein product [Rotaria socialis]|uniref:Calponin-homology (CH) domain-containing protein n=2 Tax=Rotaria socialis TaxID=392032 RepID=A0A821M9Z4_9BILA|nr:unnamed protein product [Rotaria socialis]CAF4764043.1 unnamed protein product [Rotaria socialis]